MAQQQPGPGGFWRGVFQNAVGSWVAAFLTALITPPLLVVLDEANLRLILLMLDQGAIAA